MKVKVLEKDWEVKPITPQKQRELFTKFTANQPEVTEKGKLSREASKEEKEAQVNLYFECLDLAEIKDLPDGMVDQFTLGMAICSEYLGFDKKKLLEQE